MKQIIKYLGLAVAFLVIVQVAHAGSNIYVVPWNADGLSNTPIGRSYNRMADYRFLATHSGTATAVRLYLAFAKVSTNCTYSGYYAGGTGGKIVLQLETDNGSSSHLPSGKVLASHEITNPLECNNGTSAYPNCTNSQRLYQFSTSVTLAAGTLYHLVVSNIDSNQSCNWTSTDNLYDAANTSNIQPAVSDLDFSELIKDNYTGGWQISDSTTPIMDLVYSDGTHFGQGYMYVNPGYGVYGSDQVRELFVAKQSGSYTKVYVRASKIGLPSALEVTVWDNGGRVATGSVSSFDSKGWGEASLSATASLVAGQAYSIRLLYPSGNSSDGYKARPMQAGTAYGFAAPDEFPEGHFQYSANGGSTWYNYPTNRTDFDLQLYLAP